MALNAPAVKENKSSTIDNENNCPSSSIQKECNDKEEEIDCIYSKSDNQIKKEECSSNKSDSIKWQRFSEWIHCICIVTFDLELGQAMELIYPNHVQLSEQEKTNICYLAFPDSNSGCMGDTQYHIRLRVHPGSSNAELSPVHRRFNTHCIPVQKPDAGHYWGFVYFRQTKDASLPRGYFQKSFIILTRLPFFNLYYEICTLIAPRYFKDGLPLLQTACEQINNWPSLKAGDTINLQLLGNNFQTVIPKTNSKVYEKCCQTTSYVYNNNENNLESSSSSSSLPNKTDDNINKSDNSSDNKAIKSSDMIQYGPMLPPQVLTSLHDIDIFRSLSSVITHIHILWELVLIAEPILVMGTSPADCSHMVQSLVSLISPLPYCGESRPYFTIHDSEFKEFTQRTQQQGPPSIIIGVTNPFFSKPLQNWPHLIRLEENQILNSSNQIQKPVNIIGGNDQLSSPSSSLSSVNNTEPLLLGGNSISGSSSNLRKVKSFNSKFLENSPGVYTKYKAYLQKDKTIIKKILHGIKTKRPLSVQSALLRRHLLELTQSFMIPLERYIASLMPLQKDISPFKAAPIPNQFKPDDFLASLEHSGPQLTSTLKGDWEGLYKRFFRSPNFKGWYESRDLELRQTLQALQLQALSEADINKWIQGKHEVEIVDMILKLRSKLKLCSDPSHHQIINDNCCGVIEGREDGRSLNDSSSSSSSSTAISSMNCILKTSTRNQLLKHLEYMKQSLPDDLKILLNDT